MREALCRKREQSGRPRESIEHDRMVIARWQETIGNLRPLEPQSRDLLDVSRDLVAQALVKLESVNLA